MNVHSQPGVATSGPRDTRAAILDAALTLFADKGYHGTAVPEIARAAGIAAGTIYRHFDGKETLVNELYRSCKAALMDALLSGFPAHGSPREQFHALWQRLAEFAHAEPRAFFFLELHHHAPYLDDDSRRIEADSLVTLGRFVFGAVASGVIRDAEPAALVAIVWGAFVGLIRAESRGYLTLTDELLAKTEAACWDAVAAG